MVVGPSWEGGRQAGRQAACLASCCHHLSLGFLPSSFPVARGRRLKAKEKRKAAGIPSLPRQKPHHPEKSREKRKATFNPQEKSGDGDDVVKRKMPHTPSHIHFTLPFNHTHTCSEEEEEKKFRLYSVAPRRETPTKCMAGLHSLTFPFLL